MGAECVLEVVFCGVEGKISYKQFIIHTLFIRPACVLRLFPTAGSKIATEPSSPEDYHALIAGAWTDLRIQWCGDRRLATQFFAPPPVGVSLPHRGTRAEINRNNRVEQPETRPQAGSNE